MMVSDELPKMLPHPVVGLVVVTLGEAPSL